MTDYVGLPTLTGQAKIAGAIGGTALTLASVRVGDGNGAPVTPNETQTDLVRRVGGPYAITSSGRDPDHPTHWRVTALVPLGDGPFDIRELGVFDTAGDLIAVAAHPLYEKRVGINEHLVDVVFPVSEAAQVTVAWSPNVTIDVAELLRAPFLVVESATTKTPPANPALGATYIVPRDSAGAPAGVLNVSAGGPTGAWAALAHQLVQWNGSVWAAVLPPVTHRVTVLDQPVDGAASWLRRTAQGWVSGLASTTAAGPIVLATQVEVDAGTDAGKGVTPATLSGSRHRLGQALTTPHITTKSATISAPPGSPGLGDLYLVPVGATGAWAGHDGQLAQWDGAAWTFATAPARSIVRVADTLEVLQLASGLWVAWTALETSRGPVRLSTLAEAAAGTDDTSALTPLKLRRALNALASATVRQRAPGSYNYTVPDWCYRIRVGQQAPGGAGGRSGDGTGGGVAGNCGAGGGGGGYAEKDLAVTPGQVVPYVVGSPGVSGGAAGTASSFNGTMISNAGGNGSNGTSTNATGGAGGTASGGDINYNGGRGGQSGPNTNTGFTSSQLISKYFSGGLPGSGRSAMSPDQTGGAGVLPGEGGAGASGGSLLAGGNGAQGETVINPLF